MNIAEMGPYKGDVDETNTDLYLPSELWDIRPSFCASIAKNLYNVTEVYAFLGVYEHDLS